MDDIAELLDLLYEYGLIAMIIVSFGFCVYLGLYPETFIESVTK